MKADIDEHAIVEIEQGKGVSTDAPVFPELRDQAPDRLQQPRKPGPNRVGAV